MKFFAVLLAGLTAVHAQSITIGAPAPLAQLGLGQSVVVEVDRRSFTSSVQEVAVAIGILSCVPNGCPSSDNTMGIPLFSGPYSPQSHPSEPMKPSYQNFTITVPASLPQGPANINVAHLSLVGAVSSAFFEVKSVPVVLQ